MKCTTHEIQINLINIEEDKFKISDVALKALRALKGDIKVVSMAGLQRTGKSFLLNHEGGKFEVGSTVQTCTKGINMVIKRNDNIEGASCFWIRKVSDLPFDLKVST